MWTLLLIRRSSARGQPACGLMDSGLAEDAFAPPASCEVAKKPAAPSRLRPILKLALVAHNTPVENNTKAQAYARVETSSLAACDPTELFETGYEFCNIRRCVVREHLRRAGGSSVLKTGDRALRLLLLFDKGDPRYRAGGLAGMFVG